MSKTTISSYQSYIHKSRYARWLEQENRRENWEETVQRYIDFFKPRIPKPDRESISSEIHQAILNMEDMPSMRAMMTAGPALEKDNAAGYNCSFIAIDDPKAFDEAMYISMCGTGVGFSVERQYVNQLPIVAENFYSVDTIIKVKDSKIGWASAFRQLISLLYTGSIPRWDLSLLRPAGAKLKTFGGRASGPDPLDKLFHFTVRLFQGAAGRKLTSIECHDLMCFIADIVVSGGVRRSAMISLSNLSDDRMRNAKNGQWWIENDQRKLANNSAVYTEKPEMLQFLREWTALYESRSGERGIFNRHAATLQAKRSGRRKWEGIEFGTNPCVTEDTWILTNDGPRQVKQLIGTKFVAVVDGEDCDSTENGFFYTGIKPVHELKTDRGYKVKITSNHKVLVIDHLSRKTQRTTWKTVGELVVGDKVVIHNHRNHKFGGVGSLEEGWLLGNLKGDGNIEKNGKCNLDYWGDDRLDMMEVAVSRIHSEVGGRSDLKGSDAPKYNRCRVGSVQLGKLAIEYGFDNNKTLSPQIENSGYEFHVGFLRGWFDADGTVSGDQQKGLSVRLNSCDLSGLEVAQRMLSRLGIASTIYTNRRDAGVRLLPNGNGGLKEYKCQANHDLAIANDNLAEFASVVGFEDVNKQDSLMEGLLNYKRNLNRERFYSEVKSVSYVGEEAVFDCTIPSVSAFDANGLYVHNCGEILLRSKEFCNLSEVVIRPDDTLATLKRKVRIATIIGTLQSTLTDFRYLRKEWQRNAEEERLLGVSLTGIADNPLTSTPGPKLVALLNELREYAIEVNAEWAAKLGINPSAAITCIKPSGTVSQLVNSSSGIHARFAEWLMRTVREDRRNPIADFLKAMGVQCEPDVTNPDNVDIFYFPLKSPKTSVCRNDLNAIQQLELYSIYKTNWAEHNVSCTVYIKEHEWLEVAAWVYKNFDNVGGISFLPHSDHVYRQAPYTELTEETYLEALKAMPVINWDDLIAFEKEDATTSAKELACSAGQCEL